MAWTQADIDALKAAIASSVLTVSYAGPPARSLTYRSLAEMRESLSLMEREVAGSATAVTYRRVKWHRGFRDG